MEEITSVNNQLVKEAAKLSQKNTETVKINLFLKATKQSKEP